VAKVKKKNYILVATESSVFARWQQFSAEIGISDRF